MYSKRNKKKTIESKYSVRYDSEIGKLTWIETAIDSRSDKISWSDFVPRIFRNVEADKSLVDLEASSTLITDITALNIRK